MKHHVPAEKVRAVPAWRDRGVFTGLERLVMKYVEAMKDTPSGVTDEMVDRLGRELNEPELVKLTAIVAVENLRSRMNAALGLTAQGFTERCELPAPTARPPAPPRRSANEARERPESEVGGGRGAGCRSCRRGAEGAHDGAVRILHDAGHDAPFGAHGRLPGHR